MTVPADRLPEVLVALGCAGAELAAHPTDAGGVRFRCPGLPPALRQAVCENRRALRTLLDGYTPAGADRRYVFEERLGVAADLGMPVHVGSAAWLVATGESLAVPDDPAGTGDVPVACGEPEHLPGFDVTVERMRSWDESAARRRRRRRHQDSMADARAFIREAWRRVHRLEVVGGATRAAALSAVLSAMESETETPGGGGRGRGIVTVTGAANSHGAARRHKEARHGERLPTQGQQELDRGPG